MWRRERPPSLMWMETVIPGLYASAPEPLPFAPSLHIRAFLLQRPDGNILVYSTPGLSSAAAAIGDLGGVERRYLNHGHEAMFLDDAHEGPLSAPLFVHRGDADSVARRGHH